MPPAQEESTSGSSAEIPRGESGECPDRLPRGNIVQCLATQIPEFAGTREENVAAWIRRVDHVGRIHGATDGMLLLAASSRFKKEVKEWYDTLEGESLETWEALKSELALFQSNEFAYKELQRIQAKMWQHAKEPFHDYAVSKLAMMNRLDLSTREKIHLLIAEITLTAVKSAALTLPDDSMSRFLLKMRCVAEGAVDSDKKPSTPNSAPKPRNNGCRNCGKKGHPHKECRDEPSCFYCKQKGHRQFDCSTLKRLQQGQPVRQRPMVSAAAVNEEPTEEEEAVVAAVKEETAQLQLTDPCVQISSVSGKSCDLRALIDTGSPVSIVKFTTFRKFIEQVGSSLLSPSKNLRSISNNLLQVIGVVSVEITLQENSVKESLPLNSTWSKITRS